MADIVDHANHLAEIDRLIAINNVPRPATKSSICLNCGEPLTARFNFCDSDCRDDHERLTAAQSRSPAIPFSVDRE